MAVYSIRNCVGCGIEFRPYSSMQKACSADCRFRAIAKKFEGQEGCWEWPKSRNQVTGYGQFNLAQRPKLITTTAHKMSFRLFVGSIPDGMFVCHKCDNRCCFNPAHLFLGTPKDNIEDMFSKGRQSKERNIPRGEAHHFFRNPLLAYRKIPVETAIKISEASGSEREIAELYGVSRSSVRYWKRRDSSRLKTEALAKR